ncbi:MAG TPA: PP2C family protein-serine/threonine phosphatase, partial [bacterium]|nr:PP2C family protein-serine/threonine phosphatase [bacterium]
MLSGPPPAPTTPPDSPRPVPPLADRLAWVADLRPGQPPVWGALVTLFPDAEALLLLGPLSAAGAPIEASVGDLAIMAEQFPLEPSHPLRAAWGGPGPVVWHRGAACGRTPGLAREVEHHGRAYRLLPVEVLAIPVGEERVLVRVTYDPGRRATAEDRAVAELLVHRIGGGPGGRGWLDHLAQELVGASDVEEVIAHSVAALEAQAPGGLTQLYALNAQFELLPLASTVAEAPDEPRQWIPASDLIRAAADSGRPLRIPDLDQATPAHRTAPELAALPGARTFTLWPLADERGTWGVLLLGHPDPAGLAPLEPELPGWVDLVGRAYRAVERTQGLALEQEQRRGELAMAAAVQRSLLPGPVASEGWQVVSHHASDRELAGDFVLVDDGREILHVAIGDVSGRGIPASLTMMAAYSLLTVHLSRGGDLGAAMGSWSAELARLSDRNQERGGDVIYTTAIVARIGKGSGEVRYAKAGHPYPLHYRANGGAVEHWDAAGFPAGLFADQDFEIAETTLAPGDAVVLYTDGFSEANTGRGQFGLGRMARLLQTFGPFPAPVIADQFLIALDAHLHGQPVG